MKFWSLLKACAAVALSWLLAILPGGFPRVPHEKKLVLTWADEFDGNALDTEKWHGHYCDGETAAVRRGGYWNTSLARVENGRLVLPVLYSEEGLFGGGAGWYTCALDTSGLFEQAFGYFEVRCVLPKGAGLWAAFWMLCPGMSSVGNGGEDGAEIDVFESPFYSQKQKRRVSSNLHVDGYGEDHRSERVCEPYLFFNDPYEEFNTYGVEWNEKGYTFYVNGIKTGFSDFGGASRVPEFLLLSVEIGGENGKAEESWAGPALAPDAEVSDFIVDYVRVYQYK